MTYMERHSVYSLVSGLWVHIILSVVYCFIVFSWFFKPRHSYSVKVPLSSSYYYADLHLQGLSTVLHVSFHLLSLPSNYVSFNQPQPAFPHIPQHVALLCSASFVPYSISPLCHSWHCACSLPGRPVPYPLYTCSRLSLNATCSEKSSQKKPVLFGILL